jgi:dienelactone hydrolase
VLHAALSVAGKRHVFVLYPHAERGFFDEWRSAFRPDDAEDAWSRANKFFDKHMGEPG